MKIWQNFFSDREEEQEEEVEEKEINEVYLTVNTWFGSPLLKSKYDRSRWHGSHPCDNLTWPLSNMPIHLASLDHILVL